MKNTYIKDYFDKVAAASESTKEEVQAILASVTDIIENSLNANSDTHKVIKLKFSDFEIIVEKSPKRVVLNPLTGKEMVSASKIGVLIKKQ
jgi:nucleoid DNA-binding protein